MLAWSTAHDSDQFGLHSEAFSLTTNKQTGRHGNAYLYPKNLRSRGRRISSRQVPATSKFQVSLGHMEPCLEIKENKTTSQQLKCVRYLLTKQVSDPQEGLSTLSGRAYQRKTLHPSRKRGTGHNTPHRADPRRAGSVSYFGHSKWNANTYQSLFLECWLTSTCRKSSLPLSAPIHLLHMKLCQLVSLSYHS